LIEEGRYAEARRELDIALGYNRYHSAALENLRLVSRLDGKPASIPLKPVSSRWARWKASMKKLFLEDPQQQKGTPDQTGSASQGTGPQDRRGS
jgi:hypothetical protein